MANGGAQLFHQFLGSTFGGFKVYHYAAGSSTDKEVWADETKRTALPQPVTADSNGWVKFFGDGDYRLVFHNASGSQLQDLENIRISKDTGTLWEGNQGISHPPGTSLNQWQTHLKHDGSGNLTEVAVWTGSVWLPVSKGAGNIYHPSMTTGSSDNTSAIQDTIDAATVAGGGLVQLPAGTYRYDTGIVVAEDANVNFIGEGLLATRLDYYGSGTAWKQDGGATGTNKSLYMGKFQIFNQSAADIGFEVDNASFTPVFDQLMMTGFADKCYSLGVLENAVVMGCRAELVDVSNYGFHTTNSNGNSYIGIQTHGQGSRNGTDGSVGFYAANIESIFVDGTFEGDTRDCDIGIFLEEPADRVTPASTGELHFYIERCKTGIKLKGFDSDTLLHGINMHGKISGTNESTTTNILVDQYVSNCKIDKCYLSADGGNGKTIQIVDSTSSNIDIGKNTYRVDAGNTTHLDDNQAWPGIRPGYWDLSVPAGGLPELFADANITNTTGSTEVDVAAMGNSDPRRPVMAMLRLRVIVNTVGGTAGESCSVVLFPEIGSGVTKQYKFFVYADDVSNGEQLTDEMVFIPVASDGVIAHNVIIGDDAAWDLNVQILQWGVMY